MLMYLVGMILILAQCSLFVGTIFAGIEPAWISLVTFICLGVTGIIGTIYVVFDTSLWIFSSLNRYLFGITRVREMRPRPKIFIVLVLSFTLSGFSIWNGYKQPSVRSLEVPLKNLPVEFHGTTLVHLSDIHVGQTVGRTMLDEVVRRTNRLRPDIVVLTGDVVEATVFQIRHALRPLMKLKTKYGIYFVTGNHEYYTGDVDNWMRELSFMGITVLHNSHSTVRHPKRHTSMLCLAGVDDIEGKFFRSGDHGMQLEKALAGIKPHTATILLAHQPKAAKQALDHTHQVGLVLSGHTHGGQLPPLHVWHWFLQPYFSGLYKHGRGPYVYVSSGVFYWGMPMRMWSHAEIAHITLLTTPIVQ
ncbi:predicted protein [Nematostella vectensis]|uniref:Calcineurin-like phosphoesterase domain-containing protein n=1 Tax=Nematostella vectensis TaxID=45351 RepID=A7RMR2_NEMVE|nr:predicted protein [Nematostella vectensis]|eukprot:XP_001639453.1 predicted protein [Nematostella vectensis]